MRMRLGIGNQFLCCGSQSSPQNQETWSIFDGVVGSRHVRVYSGSTLTEFRFFYFQKRNLGIWVDSSRASVTAGFRRNVYQTDRCVGIVVISDHPAKLFA